MVLYTILECTLKDKEQKNGQNDLELVVEEKESVKLTEEQSN